MSKEKQIDYKAYETNMTLRLILKNQLKIMEVLLGTGFNPGVTHSLIKQIDVTKKRLEEK